LEASRAFAIIGVLAGAACLLIILLYLFIEQLEKKIIYILAVLAGFAACKYNVNTVKYYLEGEQHLRRKGGGDGIPIE